MSLVCTAPLRHRLPHGTRYAFIRSAYESYRGREQEKAGSRSETCERREGRKDRAGGACLQRSPEKVWARLRGP